jgi:hypothetical protein
VVRQDPPVHRPELLLTSEDTTDRLRDCDDLRRAWREATTDWLEARRQYERLLADRGADTRRRDEAAQTYAFATHRRSLLCRDIERAAAMPGAGTPLRATRASSR